MKRSPGVFVLAALAAMPASAGFLECVADTHQGRKGDYLNGTTAQVDEGVWEWEIGSGDTYTNIQGITADGMFHATVSTTDPSHALSAFSTVDLLLSRFNAVPATRPYAQDVDTLLDACEFDPGDYLEGTDAAQNQAYCTIAIHYYSRVLSEFTAVENVDRHITPRKSLAGWDLAAHIRAAWRAGYLVYATGMIDRILERRPDWEHIPLGTWDYTELSHGALVRVMLEMRAGGDLSDALHAEALLLADGLLAAQLPDGSWSQGDFQATAYILLGLRADRWNFSLPWQQAIIEGVDYLQANATAAPECGWAFPPDPEYGETNSEALMALAAINSLPFVDGFETGDSSAWTDDPGLPLPPPVAAPEWRPAALPVY